MFGFSRILAALTAGFAMTPVVINRIASTGTRSTSKSYKAPFNKYAPVVSYATQLDIGKWNATVAASPKAQDKAARKTSLERMKKVFKTNGGDFGLTGSWKAQRKALKMARVDSMNHDRHLENMAYGAARGV